MKLLRSFRMPCDCTGRVRYVRRTIAIACVTSATSLCALRWLPMGNVTAFGMATLFLYSTMIGAVEFCRGKWRAGSFCGTHIVLEHYYESDAFKVKCATCGRVALK